MNQIGQNFHLASIQFSTSKLDVSMRLTIFDNNEEIISVEGQGCLILPAVLFMRTITNTIRWHPLSKSTSKTTRG